MNAVPCIQLTSVISCEAIREGLHLAVVLVCSSPSDRKSGFSFGIIVSACVQLFIWNSLAILESTSGMSRGSDDHLFYLH